MAGTTSNALNISQAGVVSFDGTATFTGSTLTNHNILIGGTNNSITNKSPSATIGVPLISNGSSSDPAFGTAVVAGGGTGQVTLTNHAVLVGAGTNAITQLAAGSTGQVLQSGGASGDPSYSTATYPSIATSTGTILRADGTNWSATTATYPNTAGSSGNVLTSNGTNWASSSLPVMQATVILNSAQIKALHATPIQLVASPGAGKMICVIGAIYGKILYGGSNVFVAGAGQVIGVYYGTVINIGAAISNTVLTGSQTDTAIVNITTTAGQATSNGYENSAINLYNVSATEITGNAANDNTVGVSIVYTIATLS